MHDGLGLEEITRLCRVAPETVHKWVDRNGLPAEGAGGDVRVSRAVLGAFLASRGLWVPPELGVESGPCVLVVDDEADIRRFIARVLRRLRPAARIHEAADGFEAGQKVMSLMPDAVVLDVHLPGLDGTKVCQNIRARAGFKETRVLAISGDKDPALRETILKEGADGFLVKPFQPNELEAALEKLLAGR
jgi:CheY-like chemotaxis protein